MKLHTPITKRISVEQCEELIGHCWRNGPPGMGAADGRVESRYCEHCGMMQNRKWSLSEWETKR